MSRQLTTRAQVSGYRFGLLRAEHALIRRDARMLADPMRSQLRALTAGAVLAVLLLAGAGIYGLIRPAPSVSDATIVAGSGGGLYVLVDGVMHPAANLASARLIAGRPLPVRTVGERALSAYPRGAALGIVGAPSALPGPVDPARSVWTVCDDPAGGTAVIAGAPAAAPADPATGVLVRAAAEVDSGGVESGEAGEWLLYHRVRDGAMMPVRARVAADDLAVRRALGLDGVPARPISRALLNAFPPEPELAVPTIAGRGTPGPGPLRDRAVGTVIRARGVDDAPSYFVVLTEGLQPLTATAAQALRAADPRSAGSVDEVSPGAMAGVPLVRRLPVESFPEQPPTALPVGSVLCRSVSTAAGGERAESLLSATQLPLPAGARVVAFSAADGEGPGVDGAYLRPGTGEHVSVPGGTFYVTDAGVRHRVPDAETAQILGLAPAQPAPWSVVSLLPSGPSLSREAALLARDVPAGS